MNGWRTMPRSKLAIAVGRVAAASRKQHKGTPVRVAPDALAIARDDLVAARLEVAIDRALTADPPYKPLSRPHRERLADYLVRDDA